MSKIIAFIVGLALTAGAVQWAHYSDLVRLQDETRREMNEQANLAERRFASELFALNTFRAFFAGSEAVTPEEFFSFQDALFENDRREHVIRSAALRYGWLKWDPEKTGAVWVRESNGDIPGIEVSPEGRAAIERALVERAPREEALVTHEAIFTDAGSYPDVQLLTLLVPVATSGHMPMSRRPKSAEIPGFVFVTIDLNTLLRAPSWSFKHARLVDISYYAGDTQGRTSVYSATRSFDETDTHAEPPQIRTADVAGQSFRLSFEVYKPEVWTDFDRKELIVAGAGLLLTLVAVWYLGAVERQNRVYRRAQEVAEQASEQKSRFLANMSHEIRTPLSAIVGMAKLLDRSRLTRRQRVFVKNLGTSAQSLLAIINDILDFAKIEGCEMELDPKPTDVARLVHSTGLQFAVAAKQKGVKLSLRYPKAVARHAKLDSLRVRQILSNLIGNALKFTEEGKVLIRVEQEEHPDDPKRVRLVFSVQDTGIGISDEAKERIFDRFTQADVSTTKEFGGTGLGLAICKQLVTMMSGEISVQSEPDEGTTFSFWIPVELVSASECAPDPVSMTPAESETPLAAAAPVRSTAERFGQVADRARRQFGSEYPAAAGGQDAGRHGGKQDAATAGTQAQMVKAESGLRVLLVEDDAVNQLYAQELLVGFNCAVELAANGSEALEKLRSNDFDLILMDCQMPVMDGFTASRKIARMKADHAIADVPIVALTANALKGDREKCLEAGMNDYLTKPLDEQELKKVLQSVLRKGRKSAAPPPIASNEAATPERAAPDASPAASRSGGQSDFPELMDQEALANAKKRMKAKYPKMVALYLADTARYIDALTESLKQRQTDAVKRYAHTIKSSSRLIGAEAVSKFATELEAMSKAQQATEQDMARFADTLVKLKKAFALTRVELEDVAQSAA